MQWEEAQQSVDLIYRVCQVVCVITYGDECPQEGTERVNFDTHNNCTFDPSRCDLGRPMIFSNFS